jgi:hypothetical protein
MTLTHETPRYWHGGVPDLRPGDLIQPGRERRQHDGCVFCEARASGSAVMAPDGSPIDAPTGRPDRVYMTSDRDYARFYASLYGYGDLYRVEPVGDVEPSTEDHFDTWCAPAARVVAVVDRAVRLTPGQRRALDRKWTAADQAARSA